MIFSWMLKWSSLFIKITLWHRIITGMLYIYLVNRWDKTRVKRMESCSEIWPERKGENKGPSDKRKVIDPIRHFLSSSELVSGPILESYRGYLFILWERQSVSPTHETGTLEENGVEIPGQRETPTKSGVTKKDVLRRLFKGGPQTVHNHE